MVDDTQNAYSAWEPVRTLHVLFYVPRFIFKGLLRNFGRQLPFIDFGILKFLNFMAETLDDHQIQSYEARALLLSILSSSYISN